MSWYEDWFGSDAYALVYDHRDEADARRLVTLVEETVEPVPTAHVLDIGCGRGRHARILARRGYDVTGIDLSQRAIEEARARAKTDSFAGALSFRTGDMREPACEACADGVVNLFTSFGYFESDAENQQALAAVTTALRPGGWFFQDFLNAPWVAESIVPADTETRDEVTIHQRRWIEDGRINKEITVERDDTTETYRESVRLYSRSDLEALYEEVGLELVDTFGNYDGAPHTQDSARLLLHARKPS